MARKPTRRITLHDVAKAAHVTPMTVSNVLKARPGSAGAETAARVLKEAIRLGYQPDASGRRLRQKTTNAIGIIILDSAPDFLRDPFTTNIVAGLSNAATEQGFSLILQGMASSQENVSPLSHIETDGICVLASGSADERAALCRRLLPLRQPIVAFQDRMVGDDMCSIRQDDFGGGRMIASYLIERGARRMCMLVPRTEWPAIVERHRGVEEAASASGVHVLTAICGDESIPATVNALASSIAQNGLPDAIIGGNDRMAIGALKLLAEMEVQVPDRVKVTGFNHFESAQYATPRLTTIHSPAFEMGRRGGQELLSRIRTGEFSESEIILPVSFVPGASA